MIHHGTNKKLSTLLFLDKETYKTSEAIDKTLKAKIETFIDKGIFTIPILDENHSIIVINQLDENAKTFENLENTRLLGYKSFQAIAQYKIETFNVQTYHVEDEVYYAFIEGLLLSTYTFKKYKKTDTKEYTCREIYVADIDKKILEELKSVVEANFWARTLVNEPLSYLNATKYSEEIVEIAKMANFEVNVLDQSKIEALKMAGVLAVNKGSTQPPTFNILEWKPKNAVNEAPVILVGKGVVFDTGGISIKPSAGMENMKSDMAGSAAVVGTFYALAKNKLPIYVLGLIPAVENHVSAEAITPGDIITYNEGTTVEVQNTDAEGRLILADALIYAKKYNPKLVIDIATLTGSAMRALGMHASAMMGTADHKTKKRLTKVGLRISERLVEFPLWKEYQDDLKSNIADLNNLGGPLAGAIIGGMFLKHFTNYPWIHLDIAAPAYNTTPLNYRGVGGSGVGVRLLYNFLKKEVSRCQKEEKK